MDKTRGQQRCWRKLNELSEIVGLDSKFVFVFHIWLFKVVFLFSQMSFFQSITTLNGLSKALLLPRGEKLQFIKKKTNFKKSDFGLFCGFILEISWKSQQIAIFHLWAKSMLYLIIAILVQNFESFPSKQCWRHSDSYRKQVIYRVIIHVIKYIKVQLYRAHPYWRKLDKQTSSIFFASNDVCLQNNVSRLKN